MLLRGTFWVRFDRGRRASREPFICTWLSDVHSATPNSLRIQLMQNCAFIGAQVAEDTVWKEFFLMMMMMRFFDPLFRRIVEEKKPSDLVTVKYLEK